jgi:hypothetical protein
MTWLCTGMKLFESSNPAHVLTLVSDTAIKGTISLRILVETYKTEERKLS